MSSFLMFGMIGAHHSLGKCFICVHRTFVDHFRSIAWYIIAIVIIVLYQAIICIKSTHNSIFGTCVHAFLVYCSTWSVHTTVWLSVLCDNVIVHVDHFPSVVWWRKWTEIVLYRAKDVKSTHNRFFSKISKHTCLPHLLFDMISAHHSLGECSQWSNYKFRSFPQQCLVEKMNRIVL